MKAGYTKGKALGIVEGPRAFRKNELTKSAQKRIDSLIEIITRKILRNHSLRYSLADCRKCQP